MRTPLFLVLSLTAACTPAEQVDLEYRSTVSVASRGVVLDEDGEHGVVGMNGNMACDFETRNGALGGDYTYENDVDVVDSNPAGDGGIVPAFLAITPGMVHQQTGTFDIVEEIAIPGLLGAQFTDQGFVVLRDVSDGPCQVEWFHGGAPVVETVDDALCTNTTQLTVDRETDTVFVGNNDAVVSVTPDGSDELGETGELVVWDDHVGVLYVARVGGSEVSAVGSDGAVHWTTPLDGSVVALEELGTSMAAGVMLETEGEGGLFVVIDGVSGEIRSEVETPAPAEKLVTSGDGGLVGMILDWEVHLYDLVVD